MTIRPPLKFDVIRPKVQYYFHFDPESGDVYGCSIQQKGHSVEIPKELAKQVQNGIRRLTEYKVIFKNTQYVVESKFTVIQKPQNDLEQNISVNKLIYEIVKNDKEPCIRFRLDIENKKWDITIDNELKTVIENTVKQENNTLKFFATTQNNTSVPEYTFDVDLNQLCDQSSVEIEHKTDSKPRLFCRKIYNYSYEVVQ